MALTPKRRPSGGHSRTSIIQWKATSNNVDQPAVHSTNVGVHRFLLNGSDHDHSQPASASTTPPISNALIRRARNQVPAHKPSRLVPSAPRVLSKPSGSCPCPVASFQRYT